MSESVGYAPDLAAEVNVENEVSSNIDLYRKLSATPSSEPERLIYTRERKPRGEHFSRIDHFMIKHGAELLQTFEAADESEVLENLVDSVRNHDDMYREEKTGNLTYYDTRHNVVVIVRDRQQRPDDIAPPPPYIVTAFTLEQGREQFEYRKKQRSVQH